MSRRRVRVAWELVGEMLRGAMGTYRTSLPEDVRVVGAVADGAYLELLIESGSWKDGGEDMDETEVVVTQTVAVDNSALPVTGSSQGLGHFGCTASEPWAVWAAPDGEARFYDDSGLRTGVTERRHIVGSADASEQG